MIFHCTIARRRPRTTICRHVEFDSLYALIEHIAMAHYRGQHPMWNAMMKQAFEKGL